MHENSAQPGRRRAVQATAAVAGAAIGIAVVAGCASRSGLAARSDRSAGGAIQFAAAQVVAAKSVHIHAAISGSESGTVDGSVVFAPTLQGDLTLKLDKDADMLTSRIIYDGTTVYTALPKGYNATSKAKPNAAWFAINAADAVPENSAVLAALKSDPAALVRDALAKGTFTEAGSETADGIAAAHFAGDLTGDAAGHLDVWLDSAGLPIEMVFKSSDKQPEGRAELHFSQWGQPVTITPPPADQVLTESDQISFAISGQQFKVSGDQLNGSTFGRNGVVIGTGPQPSGSAQTVCIPPSALPTPVAAPTGMCVVLNAPTMPTHT